MDLSERYASALRALLPRGALWDGLRRGEIFSGLLLGIADGLSAYHRRADDLRREADPRYSSERLPEWETATGLPDGCLGGGGTPSQRRAAVVSRLTARGAAHAGYFVQAAAAAGYTISVADLGPARWRVSTAADTVIEMTCTDDCNSALRTWGNDQLECLLSRIKPAHTELLIAYGGS